MTTLTLLDELLWEQQSLTPVAHFAQRQAEETIPLQERYYRELIALEKPKEGEQYGFEVDLEACSGCKACVSACHRLNGLDAEESWRDTGLLLGECQGVARQQVITTACHHCADPACADGCPTLAYEKDSVTGIVRHLDDQCMGCRYCEMKCPYQVPKYNQRLGIVRKCDMCQGRLAAGEAPACVQACPTEAIRIRVVSQDPEMDKDPLLPGTVPSDYTRPATRFLNLDHNAGLRPADAGRVEPAHAHHPLACMLVLVPISVGMSGGLWATHLMTGQLHLKALLVAVALGFVGLGASILHLGRPLQAWRAFLGWRRSWLSREILLFNLWAPALAAYAAGSLLGLSPGLTLSVGAVATVLGLLGIFTSVMVYADTRRPFWKWFLTATRFYGTALIAALLFSPFPFLAIVPVLGLLALEASLMFKSDPLLVKSSQLMRGPLRTFTVFRFTGAALFLLSLVTFAQLPWLTLFLLLFTEWNARSLFFRAVEEPKMPGGYGT